MKSITIKPEVVLAESSIHLADIPVNTYHKTVSEEKATYSTNDFLDIWQDMCAIREFRGPIGGGYAGSTSNI